MANIKYGKDIKTEADLQNMITGILLRQTSEFTLDDICKRVIELGRGSSFIENKQLVREKCENTIHVLFDIGGLRVIKSGVYKIHLSFPSIV